LGVSIHDSPPRPSGSQLQPPTPQHVFLNHALTDIKLKAIVDRGTFSKKEVIIAVSVVNGQLAILHTKHTTSQTLPPDWVTPKHPSASHDNGLLVVIKGEHVGKLVMRINNLRNSSIMILAVIKKDAGHPCITGEQFELHTDSLCCADEPKCDKDCAKLIMKPVREAYRKRTNS
jgi:hypothetical protein